MSAKDDLEKSRNNEKEKLKGFINLSIEAGKIVPDAQRRLRDLEAQEKLMDILPDDVAEEFAGQVLPFQLDAERQAVNFLPQPSIITVDTKRYMGSSTGTSTVFSSYFNSFEPYETSGESPTWLGEAKGILVTMAEDKARKEHIFNRLVSLKPELGESFKVAEDTFEKAKGGPSLVSQSVMAMRSVIDGLWGELAELARKKEPVKTKKYSGLQRRREVHRGLVAECLTNNNMEKNRLIYQLDKLNELHADMSQTEIGKDNLASDIPTMESLHSRWVIILSDIVGVI